ncbi:MAG TPA: hypothetical protein VJU80_07215, partial [Solirubrobacteraceae bacterium]|nr:hypothetical protein [Solirubrobacteraceae bacterium]
RAVPEGLEQPPVCIADGVSRTFARSAAGRAPRTRAGGASGIGRTGSVPACGSTRPTRAD